VLISVVNEFVFVLFFMNVEEFCYFIQVTIFLLFFQHLRVNKKINSLIFYHTVYNKTLI